MINKVSRIAIICALEETIRDEVKRMCDTDSLAELDTMALHAKENIKMLQSVKYKSLVKESVEAVKDLVKDEPQTCSVNGRPYTDCSRCEYFRCTADEPQTEYRIGYYTPTNAEILKALEDEQSGKE